MDIVAELGLLAALALKTQVQEQCHDAERNDGATTTDEQQHRQAHGPLFAFLHHTALLSVEPRLAKALAITAYSAKVAIVVALSDLHSSVANVVDLWNAKLLASRWRRGVLFVGRNVSVAVLGSTNGQAQILHRQRLARLGVHRLKSKHCRLAR